MHCLDFINAHLIHDRRREGFKVHMYDKPRGTSVSSFEQSCSGQKKAALIFIVPHPVGTLKYGIASAAFLVMASPLLSGLRWGHQRKASNA
jgi:hypothetical protein